MKLIHALFLLATLFSTLPANGAELLKVTRVDRRDQVQFYFHFDQLPKYSSSGSERRVDLLFEDAWRSSDLQLAPPDDRVVKILPQASNKGLTITLFFRFEPQRYQLSASPDNTLVLEVLLGNRFSRSYKELADRLSGLTLLDRQEVDYSNPVLLSPYKDDWMSFFAQYEAPVRLNIPINFYLPSFPLVRFLPPGNEQNLNLLNEELISLSEQKLWDHMAARLVEDLSLEKDVERKKLIALVYGEALARGGDFDNAYRQLYLLKETYPEELLGTFANYLLIYLRAVYEDPFIADAELRKLEPAIGPDNPLLPHFYLTQLDTALATGQLPRLNELLQRDSIAMPAPLDQILQVRHADYWYAINQNVKAYAAYSLLAKSPILQQMPFSMAGNCATLYSQKLYREAASCYDQLTQLLTDRDQIGLSEYRKNMALWNDNRSFGLIDGFAQVESAFPGSSAAYLAELKKNDLLFLQDRGRANEVRHNYQVIAETAIERPTVEEALFKVAIIHTLNKEYDQAITLLQRLLREFQIGQTRTSTYALLIQTLPLEIKRLVEEAKYIPALVLAKQNRELFEKNWLSSVFLVDIAEAYYRVGIFDEAQKLYLYLIEISPVETRERFYLPMIKATFEHGNYALVEDYCAQYLFNYPEGGFLEDIGFLRLEALVASERINEALERLPSPLPNNPKLQRLAARLYFRTDSYIQARDLFEQLQRLEPGLDDQERFMLAESLFQSEKFQEAKASFLQIHSNSNHFDQATYRLAQLERKNGNEQKALSLFAEIVEKGKSEVWKEFAKRELQYANFTATLAK